jgi:hypothetical protein
LLAIGNTEKFENLVGRLRVLISDLSNLTADLGVLDSQRLIVEYEMELINNEASLEAIAAAGGDGDEQDAVSTAAKCQFMHVQERTAVSRALLSPDDSISVVTDNVNTASITPVASTDFMEIDQTDFDQPIGVHRVADLDWRRVKSRPSFLPFLPTILISEQPSERVRQISSPASDSGPRQSTSITRIAINSRTLLDGLIELTGAS